MKKLCSAATFLYVCCQSTAYGSSQATEGSLNELLNTKIYSASKKPEDGNKSPSAQYVITEEDLKQMGVRHVADALRTVPGLQVSKISSNKWMVASRGFGEQFSNKLLVLIDGRPVYTTLFSGVLWDQQDVPIQDIKQIEVIRGPGAAMWGSNAVNGVINIITKSSETTLGTKMSTTAGFTDTGETQLVLEASHGLKIDTKSTMRSTLKLRSDPSYVPVNKANNNDDSWKSKSANLRYDHKPSSNESLSVQGGIYTNKSEQIYTFPTLVAPFRTRESGIEESKGGNILADWSKNLSDSESVSLKGYVDYFDWSYVRSKAQMVNTSVEGQYDFLMFDSWETISSVGYRVSSDSIENGMYLSYNPDSYTAQFFDALFQTKIPLVNKKVFLTAGSRLESNSYTELALSPSIKLSYEPDPMVMLWSSWSKAQRIPSRGTYHLTTLVAGTPTGYVAFIPNRDFEPEKVDAYEAGLRLNPLAGLSLDSTVFYNNYNDLRTFEPTIPFGNISSPRTLSNLGEANTKGLEVSATYQTTPDLRLNLGYSYHELSFSSNPGTLDTVFLNTAGRWPEQMWSARAAYNIAEDLTLNSSLYYNSNMAASGIPSYSKLDANLAWYALESTELILGVDNITDDLHPEYSAPLYGERLEIPRLFYLTVKVTM